MMALVAASTVQAGWGEWDDTMLCSWEGEEIFYEEAPADADVTEQDCADYCSEVAEADGEYCCDYMDFSDGTKVCAMFDGADVFDMGTEDNYLSKTYTTKSKKTVGTLML